METSVLQLIAYVALTIASVTITAVSATFGYRQNFGWKPLLLVTGHSLSGEGNKDTHGAIIDFEFWNRRKYPIVIRSIIVQFKNIDLIKGPHGVVIGDIEWHPYRDGYITRPDLRLDSASHKGFKVEHPFKAWSLDKLKGEIVIEIFYTDPIRGDEIKISATRDYSFGYLAK
jgi:hypothetical protein